MTHRAAIVLMILSTILWSIGGVVTRFVEDAHRFEIAFWRSFFASLTIGFFLFYRYRSSFFKVVFRRSKVLWVSAFFWASIFTAYILALTLTSVANVLITLAVGPPLTALFAYIFLKRSLGFLSWFSIFLAAFGVAFIFAQHLSSEMPVLGTLIALFVPTMAAANLTILARDARLPSKGSVDMASSLFLGALISAFASLWLAYPLQSSFSDLSCLAVLGIFQLGIPCLIFLRIPRVLPTYQISLLNQLEILFGVTWAWLFIGETPNASALIGGCIVMIALVIEPLYRFIDDKRQIF